MVGEPCGLFLFLRSRFKPVEAFSKPRQRILLPRGEKPSLRPFLRIVRLFQTMPGAFSLVSTEKRASVSCFPRVLRDIFVCF